MAKLTPLARNVLLAAVAVGVVSLGYNFGVKPMLAHQSEQAEVASAGNKTVTTPSANVESTKSGFAEHPQAAVAVPVANVSNSKALGSAKNPLKVSIVSFHGYAPALVAEGNSLTTQPNSIYAKQGLNVEFVIEDSIPTLSTIFAANTAQCAWRTSDFWAQEQPNLRNAGQDGRAVMIVDNTQGADAVIARDGSVQRIEDLAGKKIALLQYTPSHGMVIDAIENSSMTARQKESVQFVYINADEGTAGVRAALESGAVDAAALWDPDLSLAVRNAHAHVIYSTKIASNLIFDVMVCNSKVLNTAEGKAAVQKFVAGWMEGVEVAKKNPDTAVDALVDNEEFFKLLAKSEGKPFIKGLFKQLVWTGLDDNARILGLASNGTNHYERVYHRFDGIYRAAGALANPNSPVINPQDSFDYSFIKNLLNDNQAAVVAAQTPQFTFSTAERDKVEANSVAAVTKPVRIEFDTAKSVLNKRAQLVIDHDAAPFIDNNGSAYFLISGHTDSTGTDVVNNPLSRDRAGAVVDYLVSEWGVDKRRLKVVGAGSKEPLCNEANPSGSGLNLDDCRALNRATRVEVFAR